MPEEGNIDVTEGVNKQSIRTKIWETMEKTNVAQFPRPVYRRIPNFEGAGEAADHVKDLEPFKKAQVLKVNPDKPQELVRFLALDNSKMLLVPTPRLRTGLFNRITPPEDAVKADFLKCATSQGFRRFSTPVGLDSKIKVDLVVVGSVAVDERGLRVGKGEGFSDLEYAMMRSMGAITEDTPVITTVHECQLTTIPESVMESHDISVDYIVTPERVIQCPKRTKPDGIFWSKLSQERLDQIPILKRLRWIEAQNGKDVRLMEDVEATHSLEDVLKNNNLEEMAKIGEQEQEEMIEREKNRPPRRLRAPKPQRRPRKLKKSEGSGDAPEDADESEGGRIGNVRRRRRNRRRSGDDGELENEAVNGKPLRERRLRRRNSAQGVFVGGIPRDVRVSEFKTVVRSKNVNPMTILWRGGMGHSFLLFEKEDEAENARSLLEGLTIHDKELKIEMSSRNKPKNPTPTIDESDD